MKKLTLYAVFSLASISVINSQELPVGPGSSVIELMQLITNETRVEATNLGSWAEDEIYIYRLSEDLSLLISLNQYPFGVLVNGDTPYILLDINGDLVLDTQTDYLYVPYWVVEINSTERNGDSGEAVSVFNMYFKAFQNEELIGNLEFSAGASNEMIKASQDVSYPNRDLLYIHHLYLFLYSIGDYASCFRYLTLLDRELTSRFGVDSHPIVFLYIVECTYKMNQHIMARDMNNMLLTLFPDFIPGLVYQVLLEPDAGKKDDLKSNLLQNHGGHWLVKQMIN
jgi:hypothetical protein